jgi:decaprenyl-phosphate phosphoribosyltransferase
MAAIETPVEATAAAREGGAASRSFVAQLVLLVRPGQWSKNLLAVPLALVDDPTWTLGAVARVGWAILAFTLASSCVYIGNDIADRHLDRQHPVKCRRPIASGRVPVRVAWLVAAVVAGLLATVVAVGPRMPWWPLAAYLVVNVAYSARLKHLPLIDICVVAAGFVLRVMQGYAATGGPMSDPLLTAVFTGCLVLILGKRRHELDVTGAAHRPALAGYNTALADHLLGLNVALTAGAFLLYLAGAAPLGPLRQAVLLVSVPLALLASFRYLQSVLVLRAGGDPLRAVLHDRLIVTNAALIGLALAVALVTAHYPQLTTWMSR